MKRGNDLRAALAEERAKGSGGGDGGGVQKEEELGEAAKLHLKRCA
jgi:hypothetical protein